MKPPRNTIAPLLRTVFWVRADIDGQGKRWQPAMLFPGDEGIIIRYISNQDQFEDCWYSDDFAEGEVSLTKP